MVPVIPSLTKLASIPSTFIVLMLTLVLLLGGQVIYGEIANQMTLILIIYMIMLLAVRTEVKKTEHPTKSIVQALPFFVVTFLVTLGIMIPLKLAIPGVLAASTLEANVEFVFVFGFIHAFVKAYIEEEVFRGRLSTLLGEGGQAIVFGLFHFFILLFVLGWGPSLIAALVWLVVLGFVWGLLENRTGIEGSTGSHFGYNIAVYGMIPFLTGALVI